MALVYSAVVQPPPLYDCRLNTKIDIHELGQPRWPFSV